MITQFTSRKGYSLAILALATGVYLSDSTGDWSWFSRSGSLLVVLGIILTSAQIIENSRRLKQRQLNWEKQFHRDWADKLSAKALSYAHMSDDKDVWANGRCGFFLLICGTLVWGFGDILGNL